MKQMLFVFFLLLSLVSLANAKQLSMVKNMEIEGMVEVEGIYTKNYQQVINSNIYVKKFEPKIKMGIDDKITGNIVFLYQQNPVADFNVDQASLTYGGHPEDLFFITAGKIIIPFGNYMTYMATDPLTLTFAETREAVIQGGIQKNGFMATAYTFKGEKKRNGQDDKIRDSGYAASYENSISKLDYHFGAFYITSLAETDAMQAQVAGSLTGNFKAKIPGYGYFLNLTLGSFHLAHEYITAKKAFHVNDLAFNARGAKVSAYNIEVAYDFTLANHEFTISLGHQKTKELLILSLPETRFLVGLNYKLSEKSNLMVEISQDDDYGRNDTSSTTVGTGNGASHIRLNWRGYF